MKAAEWIARNRPDIGVTYVHTTDYSMHMWPPEAPESKRHLATVDGLPGEIAAAAPDTAVLLTADDGMNHKTRCWDLERACANRGLKLRAAISAERDKYLKHHQGYGGTAWVYLESNTDEDRAASMIGSLAGIERVYSRQEFAREFRSFPARMRNRSNCRRSTAAMALWWKPTFRSWFFTRGKRQARRHSATSSI